MSQKLTNYDLRNFQLWLPHISLQNKIVDYLNYETAKLDELIRVKEKFIELLTERRRTFITCKFKTNYPKDYLELYLKKYNDYDYNSTANIKQLPVVISLQEEQKFTIEHCIKSLTSLDELINTLYSTIKLLYERRTTLISTAISGRLCTLI
jgi:hypothetical protein